MTAVSGACQITLDWTPVPGAASYDLYWSTASPVTKVTGNRVAVASPPYLHGGIAAGITYYYVVTAVDPPAESVESSEVSATPGEGPGHP